MDAVAERSGENRALIRYHFGGMAGLIGALVDSVYHQMSLARVDEIENGSDEIRLRHFVEGLPARSRSRTSSG